MALQPPQYYSALSNLSTKKQRCPLVLTWYNKEHLHSGIDYVTLEQCHNGQREKIVSHRKEKLVKQRQFKKGVNRFYQNVLSNNLVNILNNINPIATSSVTIS